MKLTKFIIAYFCLLVFSCNLFGQTNLKTASEIQDVVKILEQSTKSLEYEVVKSYLHPSKWETEENKALLQNQVYYSLLSKDFTRSCLLPDGEIIVTILIFKEKESAHQQIAQFKKEHSGFGVKVTESDEQSYYVEDADGIYAAVIKDAKVILFEDKSSTQGELIKSLANRLR